MNLTKIQNSKETRQQTLNLYNTGEIPEPKPFRP